MKNTALERKVDAVLDTDAFNEIDDQFAIAYMLAYEDRVNTKAIYAAPFHNGASTGPKDGMEKAMTRYSRCLGSAARAYSGVYEKNTIPKKQVYVYSVRRDALMRGSRTKDHGFNLITIY